MQVLLFGLLLRHLLRNHALFREIRFISYEHCHHLAVVGVFLQVFDPLVNVLKGLFVRNVEDQHHPVHAAVLDGRNRLKALLARGVPDLDPHALLVQVHVLVFVFHAEGSDEVRREFIIDLAQQQAAFAHAAFAEHQKLYFLIEVLLHLLSSRARKAPRSLTNGTLV